MKVVLGLAYEGTDYSGWQWQVGVPTLQAVVEKTVSRIATHSVRVVCAGRTDRGVHAAGQVIHFDTFMRRSEQTWIAACNDYLPSDIRVLWMREVSDNFHARFSARSRSYRYLIYQETLPWFRKFAWIYTRRLNITAMERAAFDLVGEHDFSAFRAASCQAHSPIRRIHQLTLHHVTPWIIIDITANAFLHHMVRNIVGVLVAVGQGKRLEDSMPDLLRSRDRKQAALTAAPQGLYLQSVSYPDEFVLPKISLTEQQIEFKLF